MGKTYFSGKDFRSYGKSVRKNVIGAHHLLLRREPTVSFGNLNSSFAKKGD